NAVDAMPEGGPLRLRTQLIKRAQQALERATAGAGHAETVQIEVIDAGTGMNEETRRRCFEPFFTTKGERGTGLGLAMVYGTVQRHNAEIEVESAVGKGTTMRLSFSAASAPTDLSGPHPIVVVGPLRILLVDDDPIVLKSLAET